MGLSTLGSHITRDATSHGQKNVFAQPTNLFVDVSISVDVIEVEGPLELLSDRAPQQDGQSRHEVLVEAHSRKRSSFVGRPTSVVT